MLKRPWQHLVPCCIVVLLCSKWTATMSTQSCTGGGGGDDDGGPPPRDVVLAWFKDRVLQRLGLQRPPAPPPSPPPPPPPDGEEDAAAAGRPGVRPQRHVRSSRVDLVDHHQHHHHHQQQQQQTSQIIVFPSADSHPDSEDISSSSSSSSCFTYYFQPSLSSQESSVTSAHFWFYAGEGVAAAPPNSSSSSSAPLFILTAGQRLLRAAEAPSLIAPDGWLTYHLGHEVRAPVSEGPFVLQVRCAACECRQANESSDKLPFLHLHAGPRDEGGGGSPDSRRRSAGPPTGPGGGTIPWSPSAVDLLQRPSQDVPRRADCVREDVEISFEELGWDNWIVHPKAVTFQYCRGNCSAGDRATTVLGIKQCCAPVPGTMRSLRVTTTSDGGYSLSYETLPNIIAEECACV